MHVDAYADERSSATDYVVIVIVLAQSVKSTPLEDEQLENENEYTRDRRIDSAHFESWTDSQN